MHLTRNRVVLVFAAGMGLLWLSTVPLTSGLVMTMFGTRYMATLFGIVFFSHQIGSFLGVWLGGWIYDATGSYEPIWWAGVLFGLAAAFIHLPIDEPELVVEGHCLCRMGLASQRRHHLGRCPARHFLAGNRHQRTPPRNLLRHSGGLPAGRRKPDHISRPV